MVIKNIIQYLKNENSLYINDLGLIEKVYVEAKVDNNVIFPPHFNLELNESKVGNGFAFVLFLSKNELLRIVEADMKIKEWLEELKKMIDTQGEAICEGLGTFFKMNDKLNLKSELISELNIEFEGMEPISLPQTTIIDSSISEEKIETDIDTQTQTPVVEDIKEEVVETTLTEEDIDKEDEAPKKRKTKKTLGILLFIFIILGTILFLFFLFRDNIELQWQHYQWKKEKENSMLVDTDTIAHDTDIKDNLTIEDINETIAENFEIDTVIIEKEDEVLINEKIESAKREFAKITFEQGNYYVIAGSFDTEKRAIEHALLKEKQGFSPKLLYQNGTRKIRICIQIYSSEEEALSFIQNSKGDYWILK